MHFALIITLLGPVRVTTVRYGYESQDACIKAAGDIAAARKAAGDKVKLECVAAHEAD